MQDKQEQKQCPQVQAAQKIKDIMNLPSSPENDRIKRAYGCLLGAFIGDALGSYCEFEYYIEEETLSTTMKQPGGGTHNLKPGQLTDDSEMALAMAYGLIEAKGNLDLNLNGKYYGLWRNSPPFDLGQTIGSCLGIYQRMKPQVDWDSKQMKEQNAAETMKKLSKKFNEWSQSNGCLMRITPLVLFCLKLSDEEIEKAVLEEMGLFHCSNVVLQACVAWVLALVEIINSGDAQKAYEKVKGYIMGGHIEGDLKTEWFLNTVEKEEIMSGTENMGWAKIAWTYGFIYLKRWAEITKEFQSAQAEGFKDKEKIKYPNLYQDILAEVIVEGGDTDTNACIVGGMVGALVGVNNLPEQYLSNLVKCDVTKDGYHVRDVCYAPYQGVFVCEQLLNIAPSKLQVIQ